MVRTRTTDEELISAALDAALAALEAAGLSGDARLLDVDDADGGSDFEMNLRVDDRAFVVSVEVKSYGTGQVASHLVSQAGVPEGSLRMLVADRITSEGRSILSEADWSWLDRRGRLHLRAPGVRIDLDVPPTDRSLPSSSGPPIKGRSGLTVAYWLCSNPGQRLSPTGQAELLRLAPSTISVTVRQLADAGLVDESGTGIAPELFWELAAIWRTDRTWLLEAPDPPAGLSNDTGAPPWRITGTAAAAHYGAPVVAAGEGPIELYVNGPVDVSIAARRYGAAEPGTGTAVIAVPPTSLVNERSDGDAVPTIGGWPVAPLLAVALDLAQDRRGGGRSSRTGMPDITSGTEVVLPGSAMVGLIRAIAALGEIEIDGYVIVGGVAVTSRLGQAHRGTADVDTVVDEVANPDAIEALLSLPDALPDPTGNNRVLVAGTKVEIIGVGPVNDGSFDGMTELQTLFIAAHTWALTTATSLTLIAGVDPTVRATSPFATPAALFAMKLHAIQDRRAASQMEKRGSDALDLYRLLLDLDADGSLRVALIGAPDPLRNAVRAAAQNILIDNAARTRGWMVAANDFHGHVTADELRSLAQPVVDAI